MLNWSQTLHWLHWWCSFCSYISPSSATVGKKAMGMMQCRLPFWFFHCNLGIDTKLYICCAHGNAPLEPDPPLAPSVVLSLLLHLN